MILNEDGLTGALAPIPIDTPWWQDIEPVVQAVKRVYRIDVTILRILDAEYDSPPGGLVSYLAECNDAFDDTLVDKIGDTISNTISFRQGPMNYRCKQDARE